MCWLYASAEKIILGHGIIGVHSPPPSARPPNKILGPLPKFRSLLDTKAPGSP